ncbi:glycosyltransferase [Candidatus Uhrbacteria bacterium]|nr:glycosyltransferase [Candidatus Uhrbacteria bacterium]
MSVSYSIVLPAWNEEQNIDLAINQINEVFTTFKKPFEILVIDDGSFDNTVNLVQNIQTRIPNIKLIQHATNQGKGAAVATGMRHATGNIRLFMDCDLSVAPETFEIMLPFFEKNDIVIGSRRIAQGKILKPQPWHRNILGILFNKLIRFRTKLTYQDTQCGFKAFRSNTLFLFENLVSTGWTFDVELLVKAHRAKLNIKEIPVEWHNGKTSRLKLKDAWNIWKELRAIK